MSYPDIPAWHVVGDQITEETTLSTHGTGMTQVHVVPYVIDSGPSRGSRGAVKVEPHDFTPARVEELINDAVGAKHAVADLRRAGA